MSERDFNFYVGGIEDGMIAALTAIVGGDDGYAKEIATYAGELDAETLRAFIEELTPRMPLFLVAYGSGEDKLNPPVAPVFDEPRLFRHECNFNVFVCSDDARGDMARRRGVGNVVGVYQMIADVQRALADLRFRVTVEGEDEPVLLNTEPLRPDGINYIARLPELTAYAVRFATAFRYASPDRRVAGRAVSGLFFDLSTLGTHGENRLRPGVLS
jgi:Domain of unknown function (DUF1834)